MPQLDFWGFLDIYFTLVFGLIVVYVLCGFYIFPLLLRNMYVEKKLLSRTMKVYSNYIKSGSAWCTDGLDILKNVTLYILCANVGVLGSKKVEKKNIVNVSQIMSWAFYVRKYLIFININLINEE